jgi:hypothetical protein
MAARRVVVTLAMILAATVLWRSGLAAVPEYHPSATTDCIARAGERREHPWYIFSFRNSCRESRTVSIRVDLGEGGKPVSRSAGVSARDTVDFRFTNREGIKLVGWREGGGSACR